MRRFGDTALSSAAGMPAGPAVPHSDWDTLRRLFPYLWQYKWRVLAALAFMVGAKLANVSVPLLLKNLVDTMDIKPGDPAAVLVVPVGLLLAYGALRLAPSLFAELRELVFAKATQGAARSIALAYDRFIPEPIADVVISGGGARNPALVKRLVGLLAPRVVVQFDKLFFDGDAKEAVAFAFLGWLHLKELPGNVPAATGARGPRVLGTFTPA